jgi:hypothetical protein
VVASIRRSPVGLCANRCFLDGRDADRPLPEWRGGLRRADHYRQVAYLQSERGFVSEFRPGAGDDHRTLERLGSYTRFSARLSGVLSEQDGVRTRMSFRVFSKSSDSQNVIEPRCTALCHIWLIGSCCDSGHRFPLVFFVKSMFFVSKRFNHGNSQRPSYSGQFVTRYNVFRRECVVVCLGINPNLHAHASFANYSCTNARSNYPRTAVSKEPHRIKRRRATSQTRITPRLARPVVEHQPELQRLVFSADGAYT